MLLDDSHVDIVQAVFVDSSCVFNICQSLSWQFDKFSSQDIVLMITVWKTLASPSSILIITRQQFRIYLHPSSCVFNICQSLSCWFDKFSSQDLVLMITFWKALTCPSSILIITRQQFRIYFHPSSCVFNICQSLSRQFDKFSSQDIVLMITFWKALTCPSSILIITRQRFRINLHLIWQEGADFKSRRLLRGGTRCIFPV